MRREPFTVGSYVHVVKRGARGITIYREEADRWRCLLSLRHFNDSYHSENWFRDLMDEKKANTFERSSLWPEQKPIVSVLAYTLLPNHFHLILQEIKKGGIATFIISRRTPRGFRGDEGGRCAKGDGKTVVFPWRRAVSEASVENRGFSK